MREMILDTPPQGYAACCAAIRDMDLRELISGDPDADADDRRRGRSGHAAREWRGDPERVSRALSSR